jgi:nitroreductase
MDTVLKRRSIRKPDPVPEEKLKYVLEAARLLHHGLTNNAGSTLL